MNLINEKFKERQKQNDDVLKTTKLKMVGTPATGILTISSSINEQYNQEQNTFHNGSSPTTPIKSFFDTVLAIVKPESVLKRSGSSSSCRSNCSNKDNQKEGNSNQQIRHKFKRLKRFNSTKSLKSSISNPNSTTINSNIEPSKTALKRSPSSPQLHQQKFNSTITLNIHLHWDRNTSFNLTFPRGSSFQDFKREISLKIKQRLPDDLVALYHCSSMTELDDKLLYTEKDPVFIEFLLRQEKMRKVDSNKCWCASLLWWRDDVELTLFALSQLETLNKVRN
ncbi:hypothetical protein G9A89_005292 [Geosiphon pyriformis]|nr:hypothetical protein G9A89_005292 [Geosiphon pyriformis]